MRKAVIDAFNGGGEGPATDGKVYNFADVKKITEEPASKVLLIDVREAEEYNKGHIPGALNMPFRSHPLALHLPPQDFQKDFGFEKPEKDLELVLLCASGFRAGKAKTEALEAGFKNVSLYPGSMNDWTSKGGKTI